jgi:hypothetical protein
MRSVPFLVALVACHGKSSEPVHADDRSTQHAVTTPDATQAATPDATQAATASPGLGKHGEVCAIGSRHARSNLKPVTCGPDLSCCYPCGIDGCDSVCHTAEECRMDSMRP